LATSPENLVNVENDPRLTLAQWRDLIELLIEEYGERSVLFTDAGYNNVSMMVEIIKRPYKRRKRQSKKPTLTSESLPPATDVGQTPPKAK
jgi:hypothetical protein